MAGSSIAVVVPVYNRATSCLPTLESVLVQSLAPEKLIVVDDGSTDGSAERIDYWLSVRRPPFDARVTRQANAGVSAARNRGLAATGNCELVAFLDSDDVWPADFLARTAAVMNAQPKAVAATCDRLYRDREGRAVHHDLSELPANPARWIHLHDGALSSATLFRAEQVRACRGYPEHLKTGEDIALFLPLSLCGPWLYAAGKPVEYDRTPARPAGEEGSLSRKFTDNQRRWAEVIEAFIATPEGRDLLSDAECRRRMAWRWRLAGDEFRAQGRLTEAADSYARSLAWDRFQWRTLKRYFRCRWSAHRQAA
jgi:glycosyltransferase involved in cell wall biosynthesis